MSSYQEPAPAGIPEDIWDSALNTFAEMCREVEGSDDRLTIAKAILAERNKWQPTAGGSGVSAPQLEAYEFIRDFIYRHGFSPSLTEIAQGLGKSKSEANRLVDCLKDRKLLTSVRYLKRSLSLAAVDRMAS